MPALNSAASSLCEHCALFGADYSDEYRKWLVSVSDEHQSSCFSIPYHRIDHFPRFPVLTRSAKAGCKLCAAIKSNIRRKMLSRKPWHRDMREKCSDWLLSVRRQKALVSLSGGFDFSWDALASFPRMAAKEPESWQITSLFFAVDKIRAGRENKPFCFTKMEIFSAGEVLVDSLPPLLPMAAEQTLCPQNLQLIHRWLNDCESKHLSCKKAGRDEFLPTRLLLVKSNAVHLVETRPFSETERRSIRYLALTHCWGPEIGLQYKTTSQNLQERLQGINLATFPRNIKDAVNVTRALDLEYLWIDSMCIVQDSDEELATEMAVMLEVYSNAHLTISATRAASVDEGFLHRTPKSGPKVVIPRQVCPKQDGKSNSIVVLPEYEGSSLPAIWNDQVGDTAWNERAWTLQEGLVSPRIVHFTKERLFFECYTLDCFEGNDVSRQLEKQYDDEPWVSKEGSYRSMNMLRGQDIRTFVGDDRNSERLEQIYQYYYSLVHRYSVRKLTFIEDRAAAFFSIVEATSRLTNSSAHHGLFLNDIRRALQWNGRRIDRKGAKTIDLWPTWSWLSYPGEVFSSVYSASSPVEEEAMMKVVLDDLPAQETHTRNPNSMDRRLCLNAFLREASIKAFIKEYSLQDDEFKLFVQEKEVGIVEFDYKEDFCPGMTVFLLGLGETQSETKEIERLLQDPPRYRAIAIGRHPGVNYHSCAFLGLVLDRHDDTSFKRLGTFRIYSGLPDCEGEDSRWVFKDLQRRRVVLV